MADELAADQYIGDLGNGLVRRWSTAADAEKIGACLAAVFRASADAAPNASVANEALVMFSPGFPIMGPHDFALVEDTSLPERPIVACTCLWQERWSLGGVPFGVGRPEMVATRPQYRNRGLIRAIFEMVHARSAARGDLVQAITGIEYYYRQFGYEYALDLDGRRTIQAADVPPRKEGEEELYTLRPATAEDAPYMQALYEEGRKQSLVWSEMTEADWRYYVTIWDGPVVKAQAPPQAGIALRMYTILDRSGTACGFLSVSARRRSARLGVYDLRMAPGTNWQAALPSLLRGLCELGRQTQTIQDDGPAFAELMLSLLRVHPAYTVLDEKLRAQVKEPYAWYLRVADVGGFVWHIAPVLETRIAESVLAEYSGEAKLQFYRSGLRLVFGAGKLLEAAPWRSGDYEDDEGELGCPPLLFAQLLFGYRSVAELKATYHDVWTKDKAAELLLDTLFPKQPSAVRPLGYT
jgi:hypothetical protein